LRLGGKPANCGLKSQKANEIHSKARHWLSIGTGHKGRRFDFDIAYQFGFGNGTKTVSGSAPSATGQTADGRYEYISHAVLVTVGFRF